MSRVATFAWGCDHCGRIYRTEGKRTGFVKAGYFRHEYGCSLRTPAQRRAVNRRDEAKWRRHGKEASIINDPDHPGLQDPPPDEPILHP